ncbi:HAD-IC family P-type ATPase [Sphingobium sp. DEHP117]|uniref:cation-translocating P-type ATPase n=1 Tax=Sphingobium sp. DEHP117 TaxID=2993436 RepID=UPI0027D6430C|nr:HAD-IC family P-type ATPase [Sphingobium sp. DEHP117]MDQ4421620.1 HAD-IC family P-type ATPase [Sphingobium sp. DEHP117]
MNVDTGDSHESWRVQASLAAPSHALPLDQIIDGLSASPTLGLTAAEAARRLELAGHNTLDEAPPRAALSVLLAQFRSVFTAILLIAASVAWITGDLKNALVILAVVVLNAALGFYQEYRAEHSLAALRQMLPRTARVRREGRIQEIPAHRIVPGDILMVEAGERIAADTRIVAAHGLEIDESGLTGESVPVRKDENAHLVAETPIADRINAAFMNTVATRGRGELLVTATGMASVMGQLSRSLEQTKEARSPLQRQLDDAGRRLGIVAIVLVAVLFTFSIMRGEALAHVVLESISLAVAAIPEGLPAVVTVTLAIGMRRMARQQALIKRLASVETLGCTTVICSDKTGTLTVNEMTVRAFTLGAEQFRVSGEGYATVGEIAPAPRADQIEAFDAFLMAGVLCNDSQLHDGHFTGDPTEVSLLVLAQKAGRDPAAIRARFPRIGELPFDSAHKYMATAHRDGAAIHVFIKGAPDVVLPCCAGEIAQQQGLSEQYAEIAAQGMRGLLLAHATLSGEQFQVERLRIEHLPNLRTLGLVGIVDPPRPEARDAIARCRDAGIEVKMITGDHPDTAAAIARDLGLAGGVLAGGDLARLSAEELDRATSETAVFARVAPEHKVAIVRALQDRGHVVAMTGDGVNDAPALKAADIGVAMGRKGSDVAKEAAAMILTDDNFATIVRAVREGRALYDNIIKFVRFQLSTTIGAIMTVFLAPLLGLPDPLTPVQILWVAMIMDGPPAVALALDAPRPGLMLERPRKADEPILSLRRMGRLLGYGVVMTAGTLGMLQYGLAKGGTAYGLTLAFTTFVLFQVFNVFNARVENSTTFNRRFFSNRLLWSSLGGVLLLQSLAVYWPPVSMIFGTVALDGRDFLAAVGMASLILILEEGRKLLVGFASR